MTRSTPSQLTDTNLHCPECDYNLTGSTEGRCSWCGWVIDEGVLSTMLRDHSSARRFGAIATCVVCGVGSFIAVVSLVWHSSTLSLRDGLAAVGVLIAAVGHGGLAGMMLSGGARWPIYRRDSGMIFRFGGWFSVGLGVIGATELLRSRDIQGVPVAATFEFLLAAVFYTLPGAALLVMQMVSFRDPRIVTEHGAHAHGSGTNAPFEVELAGRFGEADVTQSWCNEPRPTTPALEATIERVWTSAVALAKVEDFSLFDGALVGLRDARCAGSSVHLELGPTTYRAFVGTNMNPDIATKAEHHDFLANPLGVSASVVTADGFIAYGRRGLRVAHQSGFVHPLGGMIDLSDRRPDGSVDLFGALLRELEEELGLTREDISESVIVGLARDRRLQQPELIFDVSVRLTRRELQTRFDPNRSDGEHTDIEFLHDDPDAAIPSLNRISPVTPIAEAAYLLHGRANWGREWYERTCLERYGEVSEVASAGRR